MGDNKSAAEVEADYIDKMGPELGPVYYHLYKEVVWLHARWLQYRKLFATPENIALLNQHGSFVFRLIQDSLWEDTLLHISRLTDPSEMGKNKNLSIQHLPSLVSTTALSSKLQGLVDEAVAKAAFARAHRNKRLAHQDLALATTPAVIPLMGVSRAHVEEMLRALRSVMNYLELEYRNGTVVFELFIVRNDADDLLRSLQWAESTKLSN